MNTEWTWSYPDEVSRTWWDIDVFVSLTALGVGVRVVKNQGEPLEVAVNLVVLHIAVNVGREEWQ